MGASLPGMGYQIQYIAASNKSVINDFCHRYVKYTREYDNESDDEGDSKGEKSQEQSEEPNKDSENEGQSTKQERQT